MTTYQTEPCRCDACLMTGTTGYIITRPQTRRRTDAPRTLPAIEGEAWYAGAERPPTEVRS
jgi:hypothetical protein